MAKKTKNAFPASYSHYFFFMILGVVISSIISTEQGTFVSEMTALKKKSNDSQIKNGIRMDSENMLLHME